MNADTQIDVSGAVPDLVSSHPVHLDDSSSQPPADDPQRTVLHVLLGLQQRFGAFGKDSEGHGYNFLSLPRLLDQLRPALGEQQCVLLSSSRMQENVFILKSTLVHVPSGTEIAVEYWTPFSEQRANSNAQVTGGYETYGRRYNIMKLLNANTADDDSPDLYRQALAALEDAKEIDDLRSILEYYKPVFSELNKKGLWLDLRDHADKELRPLLEAKQRGERDANAADQ